ncbi:Ig-like domain-containing protein [Weeksellaceae bacterium TAE3-ERU29]|nr:Ig-like domain-containing protein [Weeksellaceae bacterium TAE3-ERU29]
MKNILKYSSILGFLFLFLTSCGSDDTKPSVPEIQGIENAVKIVAGESKSYKLTGGDGNFTAQSQNENIATATVDGKDLIITGVAEGKTNVTIKAGSKIKVVEVTIEKKPAIDITGVQEMSYLLQGDTKSFTLMGGDGKFAATSQNTQVATVSVDGETLVITGVSAGKTQITITSGDKTKTMDISIVGNTAGVYNNNGDLDTKFMAYVKNNKGLWFLEKVGNPYNGKRLYVSALPTDMEVGKTINVDVRSYDINGVNTGAQTPTVEVASDKVVGLKFGEVIVVLPKM